MYKLWLLLAILRIFTVFNPQSGYIHPDEFFQSVEPMADDVLHYYSDVPWEFRSPSPIRSVIFPFLVGGFPFLTLEVLSAAGYVTLSAYKLLVVPRLLMLLLSFVVDHTLYRLCQASDVRQLPGVMALYASSYIVFTYYTRTLTNSAEAVLLALLLKVTLTAGPPGPATRSGRATGLWVGTLLAVGVFTRPTFILFALVPTGYWLYSVSLRESTARQEKQIHVGNNLLYNPGGGGNDVNVADNHGNVGDNHGHGGDNVVDGGDDGDDNVVDGGDNVDDNHFDNDEDTVSVVYANSPARSLPRCFLSACVPVVLSSLVVSSQLILLDSCYYHLKHTSVDTLLESVRSGVTVAFDSGAWYDLVRVAWSHIVITPVNFVRYNLDERNLSQHGVHPRLLHLLVNMPLLYTSLYLWLAYQCVRRRIYSLQHPARLLVLTCLVPLLALSLFSHQEPRFLIPLLLPLILLASHFPPPRRVLVAWAVCNLSLGMFYGFMHQGGVVPLTMALHGRIHYRPHASHAFHLIFYHTYTPPRHLLAFNVTAEAVETAAGDPRQRVTVYDLAGAPPRVLLDKVAEVAAAAAVRDVYREAYIYVAAPATLDHHFCEAGPGLSFHLARSFHYHVSLEDPPQLWSLGRRGVARWCHVCSTCTTLTRFKQSLGLNLYKVLPNTTQP